MTPFTVELPIRAAMFIVDGVHVSDDDTGHRRLAEFANAAREIANQIGAELPGDFPGVQRARGLFRMLGIDPTKHRPSSEALLRRALKGLDQPRINTLVDVGNWCSLDFLLPLGIYDGSKLSPPIRLRRGEAGESYEAISERELHLTDRYVLADARSPFGSPITDSMRTSVSLKTTSTLVVIYAPIEESPAALLSRAESMIARIAEVCGGRGVELQLKEGNHST